MITAFQAELAKVEQRKATAVAKANKMAEEKKKEDAIKAEQTKATAKEAEFKEMQAKLKNSMNELKAQRALVATAETALAAAADTEKAAA